MLLKKTVLKAIEAGLVDRAFRRWRRPTVKSGGTLSTPVGLLAIDAVERVTEQQITDAESRRAGYDCREALLSDLSREGDLYRIRLRPAGPHPREALSRNRDLNAADLSDVKRTLDRLDAGFPWTKRTLEWIDRHPGAPASELAAWLKRPKDKVKTDVRKLKNLGLTESLSPSPGYRLSPRGKAVLRRLT